MPNEIQSEPDAQAARLITERLNKITAHAKRARRHFMMRMGGIAICFFLGLHTTDILLGGSELLHERIQFLVIAAGWIGIGLNFWFWQRTGPKFDAEELARSCGVKAIPALFATLEYTFFRRQGRAVYSALTILLPQMKASDAHLLTSDAHQNIALWTFGKAGIVRRDIFGPEIAVASLEALGQIGNASLIPAVEQLAKKKARTPGQEKVKQAALECLPILRARCAEMATARTLLRASHSEDARPDTLLRPASGSAQTNPAELLRGVDLPEEKGKRN
jgi:hypothetical protein